MTQQYSYLIFELNNSLYGVNTLAVKEIFLLPEFTPLTKAPPGIVGVIDVRGRVIPVMDLKWRFGQQDYYSLTDQVIVLEQGEQQLGIIVDEVREVRNLPTPNLPNEAQLSPAFGNQEEQIIAGAVRSDNDILVLLDLARLLECSSEPKSRVRQEYLPHQVPQGFLLGNHHHESEGESSLVTFDTSTQLNAEALTILRERANRLRQIEQGRKNSDRLKNLAIIRLNQELFSIDLENVCEFTSLEQVVPIPCCPPHIVGNMNLRGEILTLVDICQILNLPPVNLGKIFQLVVVEVEDLRVGLTIEKVEDTVAVDAQEIDLVPAASYCTSKEYFQGTLFYQNQMVSILNIARILQNGSLVVDQSG